MPVSLSGIIHHSHSFTRLEIYHHIYFSQYLIPSPQSVFSPHSIFYTQPSNHILVTQYAVHIIFRLSPKSIFYTQSAVHILYPDIFLYPVPAVLVLNKSVACLVIGQTTKIHSTTIFPCFVKVYTQKLNCSVISASEFTFGAEICWELHCYFEAIQNST